MPEIGSCTDITCDNEIKELYQCHCCLRLVCLTHLIEQANKFLDVSNSSIDETQNIFEQINQAITLNRSDVAEEVEILENIQRISLMILWILFHLSNKTSKSAKDQHGNEKQKKLEQKPRTIYDKCPLEFDGAYGLTQEKHSIKFFYAQRLVQAIADDKDPKTTKLFDGSEDVIDHFYQIPCPFINGRLDFPEYTRKFVSNVPCPRRILPIKKLKHHLRRYHQVSEMFAQELVDTFKEMRAADNIVSASLIPST
ncbi:unnamed protein product [Rotaria sp. Silwood1]|nr:unnamed protein product [Rotaria sp. Silwood1]CAF1668878.1 unnamed protein product [Rotaria sp. Silwood1]